jgi:hypothetical protein
VDLNAVFDAVDREVGPDVHPDRDNSPGRVQQGNASVLLRNKLAILLCLSPQPKPQNLNLNPLAYTLN